MIEQLIDHNVTSRVTDRLREAIYSGEFAPGDRLIERALADQFGVSHIPIREALGRLVEEGLVERTPRRGARVAVVSFEDLEEIVSLRALLEDFVVERVSALWTADLNGRLQDLVDRMFAAAAADDKALLFRLDKEFHAELWEGAEHKLLVGLASQLRGRINALLWAANQALLPDELAAHAQSHALLRESIASGDLERARKDMRSHVEISGRRVAQMVLRTS